jgi:hypothetical protein
MMAKGKLTPDQAAMVARHYRLAQSEIGHPQSPCGRLAEKVWSRQHKLGKIEGNVTLSWKDANFILMYVAQLNDSLSRKIRQEFRRGTEHADGRPA